jgi:V/A-type H+-transporting ATPase subunit C
MDLDEILPTLAQGAYKDDVERAVLRFAGLRRLHETLRSHFAATLAKLHRSYRDRARQQIALLSSRWEAASLVAIARGQARRASLEEILPALIPTARLDETALDELARQPTLRAALELLVAWGVPSRATANAIMDSWAVFERDDDLAAVEHAIMRAYALEIERAARAEVLDTDLELLLRRTVDRANMMAALRAREGDGAIPDMLPAGQVAGVVIHDAASRRSRDEAVSTLLDAGAAHWMTKPLRAWADEGDVQQLERRLSDALARWAIGRLVSGDPLSIAVPLGFVFAKDVEARNLRLVGAVATGAISPTIARTHLLLMD